MKILPVLLLLASCQSAQTPQQTCENYCSSSNLGFLDENNGTCVCNSDLGIRTLASNCLVRSTSKEKVFACLKAADVMCSSKDMKLIDSESICDFIKVLKEQGQL